MSNTDNKKIKIDFSGKAIRKTADDLEISRIAGYFFLSLLIVIPTVCGLVYLIWSTDYLAGGRLSHALLQSTPLMIACFVVLLLGAVFYSKHRLEGKLLTIRKVDEKGLYLGSMAKRSRGTVEVIMWNTIVAVEFQKKSATSGPLLLIETKFRRIYEIKANKAFAWIPEENFFSALKTYAPEAATNVDRSMMRLTKSDARYTNIWLQSFSRPGQRKRRTTLDPGTTLQNGRYEIVEKIGSGGQGTAYRAGAGSGGDVVLKEFILPSNKGDSFEAEKSADLSKEAELLSGIDHGQIVKLIDCFVEDHRGYMVLEYIEGESLRKIIKDRGAQEARRVADWSIAICSILDYLHNLSPPILHRDLTPDNLILETTGGIKLVDFTVAHQFESTRTSTVVGKQAYIPPEQFMGKPSPQSDIYALGCTMYYLLTGEDPEPMTCSHPAESVQDIDTNIDTIVSRATALSLSDRYESAQVVLEDLNLYQSNNAVS